MPRTKKVRIVKDNGDDTFDVEWCEDDAEATVDLADLKRLACNNLCISSARNTR